MICEFGCGQNAIKQFKCTKRWCCSESANKCPAKRAKSSKKKRGVNPFKNREHPRSQKGKRPWNFGKKLSEEHKANIQKSMVGNPHCRGVAKTPEKELIRRHKLSIKAKTSNGGYLSSKSGWYESFIAGRIYLDSSWEFAFAKLLDDNDISWSRPTDKFPYVINGVVRHYTPDFFLRDLNLFIEIKGFITEKDRIKWEFFPFQLVIFEATHLKNLGLI